MSPDYLPASVAFCDVETTGLGRYDRIVSFGGIGMISRDLVKGRPHLACLYLVFDPGRENCRDAEQIHGFSDSALRLQDRFALHAANIRRFLTSYELSRCPQRCIRNQVHQPRDDIVRPACAD
jgi:DNA polymerase III epsilon subunit-like protein